MKVFLGILTFMVVMSLAVVSDGRTRPKFTAQCGGAGSYGVGGCAGAFGTPLRSFFAHRKEARMERMQSRRAGCAGQGYGGYGAGCGGAGAYGAGGCAGRAYEAPSIIVVPRPQESAPACPNGQCPLQQGAVDEVIPYGDSQMDMILIPQVAIVF